MYLTSPLLDDSRLHSLHHRQTAKASTLTAEMTSYVWDVQMDGKRVQMSLHLKLRLSF